MTFPHHIWALDDETLHFDRTFWQNMLELDYDYVIATFARSNELKKHLMRFRRATLHSMASALFSAFPDATKQHIVDHIAEHEADHPLVRTVLLLSYYFQGIRRDVLQYVTDVLTTEYRITVAADVSDRVLVVGLHVLQKEKEALRLYALLNRAQSAVYHHYTLSVYSEQSSQLSMHEARQAVQRGYGVVNITKEMVQHVLHTSFPYVTSRCLAVYYDTDQNSCTAFIVRPWRRRAIREFEGMYFGTYAEMMVLEFRDDTRQGRFRCSDDFGVRVASALAQHVLNARVEYTAVEHTTSERALLHLFTDLEQNRSRQLRLRAVRVAAASMPAQPTLALAAGSGPGPLGETLHMLRERGINWLADLSALHHVQVIFQQTAADTAHTFTLYVKAGDDDTFVVTYAAQTTQRAKRAAFRALLRDEYDVHVRPAMRSS